MVSAKFHVVGEDGEWFRIRVQEEIHAHSLEGSVILAAEKMIAVVVEGERGRIESFHTDVIALCPKGIKCTSVTFGSHWPLKPSQQEQTLDYIMQLLKEIERKTTRIDQKLTRLIALQEAKGVSADEVKESEPPASDIGSEATSSFSSMFGD